MTISVAVRPGCSHGPSSGLFRGRALTYRPRSIPEPGITSDCF
jgi:hypothetical protein